MNILGPPPEELTGVKIFGKDGVSFIGILIPNREKWYNYVEQTCKMLNDIKLGGRTNWVAGIHIVRGEPYKLVSDEDHLAAQRWVNYMLDHDPEGTWTAPYGQGYAGLPRELYAVNQLYDSYEFHIQEIDYKTYTFASCVSPNPS
ncbi:hypothetical protein [Photobacterium damselae]|uniref:hypothetical protein n=1 Tax=Photobacterium damselae TaxID=38293 RepID=UPI001EDE8345|nr:hypothetical protein [Photobacterium damselae]MCG3847412.1 hypothetical protein [Photobacterium damselae]